MSDLAAPSAAPASRGTDVHRTLADFVDSTMRGALSPEVLAAARRHLLDTVGAIVSGSRLAAGEAGRNLVAERPRGTASVLGSSLRVSPFEAALANGMAAHADETDDSHEPSTTHPGCAVVPAALAAVEDVGGSGDQLLRAMVVGYEMCARFVLAIGTDTFDIRPSGRSSHATGGLFGAGFAAAAATGVPADRTAALVSYLVQQASGINTWLLDRDHVLKAYVFGGMPASGGTHVAAMVQAGFPGGGDVLDPTGRNALAALGANPDPGALVDGLGANLAVTATNIKKFAVGSPIQAAVQAVEEVLAERAIDEADIRAVRVHLHPALAAVVDDRDMPAVSLQYCVAATILDKRMTFAASHDLERMAEPGVRDLMARVGLRASLPDPPRREALLEIDMVDGSTLAHHVESVPGTTARPMSLEEIEAKVVDLLGPVLGSARTGTVVQGIGRLGEGGDLGQVLDALRSGEV